MKKKFTFIVILIVTLILISKNAAEAEKYVFDLTYQKKCQQVLGDIKGSIILLEVKSGKILAVTHPVIAFQKMFPPGSVFKIITAFALLEEGIVTPFQTLECRNFFKVDNHIFSCCVPSGHGKVDLQKAIACSCSVYFYVQGQKLAPSKLNYYARFFSLGKNSDIPFSGASAGKVKLPSDQVEYTKMLIGEGGYILVTPWQMVVLMKHLITEDIPHKKNNIKIIKEALHQAAKTGIARKAALENILIAGKTGTATNLRDPRQNHGWFIGFAPYQSPEIIVVVFLQEGRGYDEAASLAKKVFWLYFNKSH